MNKLLDKISKTHTATRDELIFLLENNEVNNQLFNVANEVRKTFVGEEVHLRGLIEFSNICKQNCYYCGLRCDNHKIERYKLSVNEIINIAEEAKTTGYKTVVLQSGESNAYSLDEMIFVIKNLKSLNLAITLSLGEKTFEEYEAYKLAGADRYLLRIETTDKNLYTQLHPNMDYENRVRCLKDLRKLNYEVGSGFLVGLPNQSIESLADDLLFMKEIGVDMAGIGPFIPNPDTPLANANYENNFILSLKIMALMRLMLPDINIPATTAMETLNPNGRIIALNCGANVVMPNVTDVIYRQKYQLYPGKTSCDKLATDIFTDIKSKIENINRKISSDFGTSKAWQKRRS